MGCGLATDVGIPSPWATWNGSLDGTTATFSSGNALPRAMCALSVNASLTVYEDIAAGGIGKAVVTSISDTTQTEGTSVTFSGTDTVAECSVAALSATKAIVCFRATSDADKGKAVILDISGTSITVNSIITFTNSAIDAVSVSMLSSTSTIVVYDDTTNFIGSTQVLTVSGSFITGHSVFNFTANNLATNCIVESISPTQAIVLYSDDDNNSYGTAQILNISSTTVTGNASYVFNSDISLYFRTASMGSGKFAVVYSNFADSQFPSVQILTANGTVVTFGSSVRVVNLLADDGYFGVCKADNQSAFIIYRNVTTGFAAGRVATTSGISITLHNPVIVQSSSCLSFCICDLDTTRVIYSFSDGGNSSKATGKVSKAV